jgi:predicted nucleic-acid-binding Zn-ribbon protein
LDRICPKCEAAMTQAMATIPFQPGGKLQAFKEPLKRFGHNTGSTLSVFICSSCGFAEFYADHPERFAPEGS